MKGWLRLKREGFSPVPPWFWLRLSGGRHAGWETRDTAGLETCGTSKG